MDNDTVCHHAGFHWQWLQPGAAGLGPSPPGRPAANKANKPPAAGSARSGHTAAGRGHPPLGASWPGAQRPGTIKGQATWPPGDDSDDSRDSGDDDIEMVTVAIRPRPKRPPLYKVVMLNDDFTPMAFVVGILQRFFSMDFDKATQVMLQVHREGKAVCGIYSKDIAETKVAQVIDYAREREYPLMCQVEATPG